MAEEIQEAVQIIRVGYDGLEIVMKVCGGTLEEMKKALDFLIAVLDREKAMGKTDMRKLLMKGGDMQVFQFPTEDMKKVKRMAKKYGILYSVLPDINKEDGMSEIIFHTEAVPRVNMMIEKLKSGRVSTFDDYLKNGEGQTPLLPGDQEKRKNDVPPAGKTEETAEEFMGLVEEAGGFAAGKESVSVDEMEEALGLDKERARTAVWELVRLGVLSKGEEGRYKVLMDQGEFADRMNGYRELARRVKMIAASKDPDRVDITITKKLIVEENDHAIKTRIPGTWGENARYIWFDKDRLIESRGGKSILTFLERDRDYEMYAADNSVASTIKGKALYEGYYDEVDAEVLKWYKAGPKEQARKKQAEKKRPAAGKKDWPGKRPAQKKKPVPGKGRRP